MLVRKMEKSPDIEKKRREFIDKGGSVKSDQKSEWTNINLRVHSETLSKVDDIVKNERTGKTRTAWILEAIQEKLKGNGNV